MTNQASCSDATFSGMDISKPTLAIIQGGIGIPPSRAHLYPIPTPSDNPQFRYRSHYWQPPDASTLVIRSFLDFFGCHSGRSNLLLILLTLVVDDVVEAELVDTLGGGDDTEPVTELLLLEVLLGADLPKRKWSEKL